MKEQMEFFKFLGSYNSENNLSDIVYFACKSSHLFKQLFLKSIFPDIEINDISFIDDIEREVWSEDKSCRIDFKFIVKDEVYLVENKIYDLDDHFTYYTKQFTNCKIGFIANYDVQNIRYDYKTSWNQFSNFVDDYIKENGLEPFVQLVCIYIKEVCNFMEERQFNHMNTSDLHYVQQIIENIIMQYQIHLEINKKAKGCTEERLGKYFWLDINNMRYHFWFGLYLNDDENNFWFEICDDCDDTYQGNEIACKYDGNDSNSTWFHLSKKHLDTLKKDNVSYSDKVKILKDFFDYVIKGKIA